MIARLVRLVILTAVLAGCVSPASPPMTKTPTSTMAKQLQEISPAPMRPEITDTKPAKITPLPAGADAMAAWLWLIDGARSYIDVKTFIYRNDGSGRRIEAALMQAADRGVEVRVLVDDLFHHWVEGDLSVLARHPGIEVRLFNPFNRYLLPPFNYLLEFDRVNHRMHTKMILADGERGIVGGRNVGDEYFLQDADDYFLDFDIAMTGPAVTQLQASFDAYWDDVLSIPAQRIGESGAPSTSSRGNGPEPIHLRAPDWANQPVFHARAAASVVWPESLRQPGPRRPNEVALTTFRAIAGAKKEVLLVTPYFIPEKSGTQLLSDLATRGVRVRVLTNSLASTNHPAAHAGYMRYRRSLLNAGVEIFEFRGNVVRPFAGPDGQHRPRVVMHSKLVVVDGRYSLVGSANFDPRSFRQNGEIAVFLDSPELASWITAWVENQLKTLAYKVRITPGGGQEWSASRAGTEMSRKSEPVGSALRAAKMFIFSLLPLDRHL